MEGVLEDFVQVRDAGFAVIRLRAKSKPAVCLLWGHGWGHSSAQLRPLAEALLGFGSSVLIDFPGFGASPPPPTAWGTAQYAECIAQWLEGVPRTRRIWIGHSFGCRVGIQIAALHPELLDGLVLIAAAGLPRRRSLWWRSRVLLRKLAFRLTKFVLPDSASESLKRRFGSPDYANAGNLRPTLVKVVNEDLSREAGRISCPTLLLYGSQDSDTPVEIGERFKALIPNSKLVTLDNFDHHTILSEGLHQVTNQVKLFIQGGAS